MQDFKQLIMWQKAHELTLGVYKTSATFPSDEKYGLTGQVRRACASIPANIAEGCGRDSDGDFARFLRISMGSAFETEYHLMLARDLGLMRADEHQALDGQLSEVKRMLYAFIRKLVAET